MPDARGARFVGGSWERAFRVRDRRRFAGFLPVVWFARGWSAFSTGGITSTVMRSPMLPDIVLAAVSGAAAVRYL